MPNPANELVDVVDDEGRTIATVTRREVRERQLPHRCTWILVFNQRGDLFIHLRTPTKDSFPLHWDVTVGGILAAGESLDAGAQRELEEEIGIVAPLEPLFPYRYTSGTIAHGMVYRLRHEGPFRLQPEEIVRGEFISLAQLPERTRRDPFCAEGLEVLAEYRRRFN
jgi:isopentenyldiphosphate isomerase